MLHGKKLIDTFIFNNELDILEIRLHELDPVVDWFVLVEGNEDFKGAVKRMEYDENSDRFAAFRHKIIHIKVEDYPQTTDAWAREAWTRNATLRGVNRIEGLQDDDFVILSDVDEIILAKALQGVPENVTLCNFNLSFRYYKFNCRAVNDGWGAPIMVRKYYFTDPQNTRHHNNPDIPWADLVSIENAGWHFSYMGGVDSIVKKIEMNAHQELNTSQWKDRGHIEKALRFGKDLYDRDGQDWVFLNDGMDKYPRHVQLNMDYFSQYFEVLPQARFRCVIPYTGNAERLRTVVNSVLEEIGKYSMVMVGQVVVINNSEKPGNLFFGTPEVKWVETVDPLLLPQVLNRAIKFAEMEGDDFMFWMHDDAELRPNALKIMLEKWQQVKGTKWAAIFGCGAGDVCSFYNPAYNFETGIWYDPLLFPMYFMDCHYFRVVEANGWKLEHAHDDGYYPLVTHYGSHTIKENYHARVMNDFMQKYWSRAYEDIWGGRPGQETITDPYANGFPREI